ncbi:tryptophan synthase subunit alpha [Candidatus Vidania fulgoroideorum]
MLRYLRNRFIPFLIPFYPNKKVFIKVLKKIISLKINYIEIGINFYENNWDSNEILLAYKKTKIKNLNYILNFLKKIKKKYNLNFLLVCCSKYFDYGLKKFLKKINKVFKDILIVDVDLQFLFLNNDLFKKTNFVSLIPLEMSNLEKNIKKINNSNCSIIYLQTNNGLTGKNKIYIKKFKKFYKKVYNLTKKKIVVGFGINKKNIKKITKFCKFFIIGSFFIKYLKNVKNKIKKKK